MDKAVKHFMIGARGGDCNSVKNMKICLKAHYIPKGRSCCVRCREQVL